MAYTGKATKLPSASLLLYKVNTNCTLLKARQKSDSYKDFVTITKINHRKIIVIDPEIDQRVFLIEFVFKICGIGSIRYKKGLIPITLEEALKIQKEYEDERTR
jgi:hypothetical protein